MARDRRTIRLALARVWAYPLWCSVIGSESAGAVAEDVDWWMRCIGDAELLGLDPYSRFAYLSGALTEFRTLVHYRLRSAPAGASCFCCGRCTDPQQPSPSTRTGSGRDSSSSTVSQPSSPRNPSASHCWINQQVTIGHDATGRPTLGDRVRVGAGAVVIGPITLHDGATVGANATVIHDVGPGETVVAPLATALKPRRGDGDAPA